MLVDTFTRNIFNLEKGSISVQFPVLYGNETLLGNVEDCEIVTKIQAQFDNSRTMSCT